jgi:hypothetical protein
MAKTPRRQVEFEAVAADELDGQATPNIPPPTNAAARKRFVAPATNAAAAEQEAPVAPAASVIAEVANDDATTIAPPPINAPASRRPPRASSVAPASVVVRANPTPNKATSQRATVASGQLKAKSKPVARKSGPGIGMIAGGVVVVAAVVLLVFAAVTNGGKVGVPLPTATAVVSGNQTNPTAVSQNNSPFNFPTQQPGSTESADYGQTPKCSDWAAKVDNEVIRCDVYLGYVQGKDQSMISQFGQSGFDFNSPAGRRALEVLHEDSLDELIDDEVAALEAPKEGVTPPKDYIDQQMGQARQAAGFSDDASWEKDLESRGTSMAEIRHNLEKAYLLDQMTKKHGTAPNQETWLKTAHILVGPKDKALADSIYQQLQNGGDFAALAKQYSIDQATRNNGGVVGFVSPDRIDVATSNLLKSLKDGATAPPLGTRQGWEIIRVLSRELRPVEDPSSLADQSQADFQAWARPLWTNHTIVKNVTFLPTITPDMSKQPPTFTPDPARGTPYGITGLGGVLATPVETQGP